MNRQKLEKVTQEAENSMTTTTMTMAITRLGENKWSLHYSLPKKCLLKEITGSKSLKEISVLCNDVNQQDWNDLSTKVPKRLLLNVANSLHELPILKNPKDSELT